MKILPISRAPFRFRSYRPEFRPASAASYSLTRGRHVFLIAPHSADVCFAALLLLSFIAFSTQLRSLLGLAVSSLDASHVVLIPPLCAFLIWFERKKIPREGVTSSPRLLAGTVLAFALSIAANGAGTDIRLGTTMLLVFWISAFTLCYGLQAAYAARFSLLLLFLTVPPPQWLMDRLMIWFQHTSVWLVDVIFRLLHVPAVRHGAFFFLPAGYFHIGPGCSGTRSMIAFLIISLILGHLLFRSIKSKVLLIASIVPILIFKNGVRIVILSLLAFYVDKGFLTGRLHSDGGILFFLLGILLWIPLVRLVQRLDYK